MSVQIIYFPKMTNANEICPKSRGPSPTLVQRLMLDWVMLLNMKQHKLWFDQFACHLLKNLLRGSIVSCSAGCRLGGPIPPGAGRAVVRGSEGEEGDKEK